MEEKIIYSLYIDIANAAMNRGYDVKLSYNTGNSESKTFISQSKSDTNTLEMNAWRPEPHGCYEDGYDQGCMDMLDDDLGEEDEEEWK